MDYKIPPELDVFLDKVLKDAHGGKLPDELKQKMKRDLYGRLQNHLLASYLRALPDGKADEFDAMMSKSPEQEAIEKFFQENIPNFNEVAARSLLEFRDVYIGATKK